MRGMSLRGRFDALRRDLRMVIGELRGDSPSPLVTRKPRAYPRSATAAAARPMVVRELRRETADATTLVLADPTGAVVTWVPGQFLTLMVTIDGQVLRRAYSINSDVELAVTSKRIPGGRVSTHLNEHIRVGDTIPVLGPSGEFKVPPDARELVLIAGGSGITPIMAIARAARKSGLRAALIYGNRTAADIIFRTELDRLGVPVRHVLEVAENVPRTVSDTAGRPTLGRLDRATLAGELDAIAPGAEAHYFVCGPAPVMAAAREELQARGVPAARVHEERFATAERKVRARTTQRLTVRRGPLVSDVVVAPDATLLDAALAAGVTMPYSCAMGGCGACAVDLVAGDVDLDEPNCLSPDERARGRILACVARPCGPCTVAVTT